MDWMRMIKPGMILAAGALAAGAPATPQLLQLSDADMMKVTQSGCNFVFDVASAGPPRTLVFAINPDLVVRTATGPRGVKVCQFAGETVDRFTQAKGPISCGGVTMRLQRVGKSTSNIEGDSASFPATLTITRGPATSTIRGTAGTAC